MATPRPPTADTPATPHKRSPRTVGQVDEFPPTELAMMTRWQVDDMTVAARQRRRERLLSDTTTRWGIRHIAQFAGVEQNTVSSKWRWKQIRGVPVDGTQTVLPAPLPGEPLPPGAKRPPGRPGPSWLMSDILRWAAQKLICDGGDRGDYVAYPAGRRGGRRAPDAEKPPLQRGPRPSIAA